MWFIIELEQRGWLYNWSSDLPRFEATAAAMRRRGLSDLAQMVSEAGLLLSPIDGAVRDLVGRGQSATWNELTQQIDPNGKLKALSKQISALSPSFGIPEL